MKSKDIKEVVRENYGRVAATSGSCCGPAGGCCGGGSLEERPRAVGKIIGYSSEEMNAVPDGANLGLGCGNPLAISEIKEGDTVLDLGSGAGFDCFIAARKVGETGKVIGVDMTPEMLDKARENAAKAGFGNVEFRRGEIENLPVDDASVDVIISNCVINLSPDKPAVFQEAFRVLKPGGRLMVSDIVLLAELPDNLRRSVEAYVGCVAGAVLKEDYLGAMREAGFADIDILKETAIGRDLLESWSCAGGVDNEFAEASSFAASVNVFARKQA